ncbi:MAG: hypothetical protein HY544_02000 [Candidatus Diapherotrites archaeon]|uniref:CASTOR ACT domain-containing protein n=1 Tax=Candidatus Iainarchaeum sp. TaxID=3101447 RepID=A0A8T3YMH6_9ARCH|nr:hypothetical protein [Candidatus Diapherotrites archaeon]
MNTAKLVFEYLENRPSIKQCLKAGLINYSALARKIASELRLSGSASDAIMVACRRFSEKSKPAPETDSKIVRLVKSGKFEMRNRVSAFILSDDTAMLDRLLSIAKKAKTESDNFHLIQGTKTITVVLDDDFADEIEQSFAGHIVRARKGLLQITHKTSEKIEETPGFLSFLTSMLSESGINIYECASSWTDTIFLIDGKDAQKALALLDFRA